MHTLRRVFVTLTACAVIGTSHLTAGQDQGPVTKPLSDPLSTARLPAPVPTASQGQDGRITVTWAAVAGAVRYRLWRSVPPAPATPITQPNPEQPGYVDADVKAGSTYYYLVSAVNEAGVEGLRGGTAPLTATISAGATSTTSTTAQQTISVRLVQQEPPRFDIRFSPVSGATAYRLVRRVETESTGVVQETELPALPATATAATDTVPPSTNRRRVRYVINARLATGYSPTVSSSPVILEASASSEGATYAATPSPAGSTTLTVAAPATVTTGASASLSAVVGSSARWLSLDESVATVDSSGTITGRAAGHTRILAFSASSDGSLRVVAIAVTVRP